MNVNKNLKKAILPSGRTIRRLPLGLARGLWMGIDFQRGETRLFLGLYEMELNAHLRRLVKPGHRCFDVGGQYGYDALVLARLSQNTVVSVECDTALAAEMRENFSANPALPAVTVVPQFVGPPLGSGVTIDELAEQHFVPDFIKMDIEGGEADALVGASAVLAQRPALLIEVHGADIEWRCLEILRGAGYPPPRVVEPRAFLREHRPISHNRWLIFEGQESVHRNRSR